MTDDTKVFCQQCGESIGSSARFCGSCGSPQETAAATDPAQPEAPQEQTVVAATAAIPHQSAPRDPPRQAPPGAPAAEDAGHARRPAAERIEQIEQVAPGARDFADSLAVQLSAPGLVAAVLAALCGLAAAGALGLVAAIVSPDKSLIGLSGQDVDVLKETLRLTAGSTMARVELLKGPLLPAIFVLAPLGGTAFGAYTQAHRTAGLSPRAQLAWSAAAGVPLAVLMLIVALLANGELFDYTTGSVLFYGLLWGAIGGVAGTWWWMRQSAPETLSGLLPTRATRWGSILRPSFVALAAALVFGGLLSLAAWEFEILRGDQGAVSGQRSTPTAAIETVLYAPNLAVGNTSLGMISQFDGLGAFGTAGDGDGPGVVSVTGRMRPLPIDLNDASREAFSGAGESVSPVLFGQYRIFDYSDIYPAWVFIPMLILMIGVPALLALYSGFAIARRAAAPTPALAAGYGALTGVVWAITLSLAAAIFGVGAVIGSVLVTVLVVGAACGALGGFLGAGRPATAGESA